MNSSGIFRKLNILIFNSSFKNLKQFPCLKDYLTIKFNVMIDPKDEDYSTDPNDALRREDDTENIDELDGDSANIEHDKDLLEQADEASRSSYELNVDDLSKDDLDD